jgi:hypothetical protein
MAVLLLWVVHLLYNLLLGLSPKWAHTATEARKKTKIKYKWREKTSLLEGDISVQVKVLHFKWAQFKMNSLLKYMYFFLPKAVWPLCEGGYCTSKYGTFGLKIWIATFYSQNVWLIW